MQYEFHPYLFNPLYWIMQWALKQDGIRFIYVYGGSSAAKTYSITQALTVDAVQNGSSSMILRKFGVDIEDSVFKDFKEVGTALKVDEVQTPIRRLIRYKNGAVNRFRGLDESEKLKGLKGFKYLYYNEFSLFDYADFGQGKKRLRGMPGQKIICDWNPIIATHWIKSDVLDLEEWHDITPDVQAPTKYCRLDPEYSFVRMNKTGNALLIKVTYRDNYWIVGHPSGKKGIGYVDKHVIADFEHDRIHKPNDYRIYGLGEWGLVRTGSEFWKCFDESKHVRVVPPYRAGPIHISLDNNVHPYVTISVWQVDTKRKKIRQFMEFPCKSPNNTASKAAKQFSDWLRKIGFTDKIFIYGDPSAKARSTVDDEGRSFFDKFIGVLHQERWSLIDRVQRSAPQVSISADFINDIYESNLDGWSIEISQKCRTSIDDYCMTKEDMNGHVLKKRVEDKEKGISYEPYGHFSDAKRYFIITILKREYLIYKNKRKRRRSRAA